MALNPKVSDWTDRVVWLIGASSGIGRATAERLHAEGARVVVSARSAAALQDFAATCPGSEAVVVDTTDRQGLHEAAQGIVRRHGHIDQLVYCAGTYRPMRATAFDLDEALRHLQVNYVGVLNTLDAVLPQLLQQAADGTGAHLCLVASVAGYRGLPQSLAYGPTKAALINLAETLYLDLSPRGIGVSLVNPGFVKTPLTEQNPFDMPALISPAQAAAAMVRGWERGRFEIHFPKRFTWAMKALRFIDDRTYFWLVRHGVSS